MNEKAFNKVKKYCPICNCEHEIIIKEKKSNSTIKGQRIPYMEKVYFCSNADEEECEFVDSKMLDENLLAARDAYRIANNLLTSSEIKAIRSKYSLTQLDFAKLLDCGDVTITRYETKQIQDKSHDEQMRQFENDSAYAYKCLLEHEKCFSKSRFLELKNLFMNIIDEEGEEQASRQLLSLQYVRYDSPSKINGYKVLDITKLEAIISYFAKNLQQLYKVKLMKLLWYTDMIYFREYGESMTGLVYTHEPMGALPVGHYSIMSLNNVICEDEFDPINGYSCCVYPNDNISYNFFENEIKILEIVKEKFRYFSGKDISEYMHQEDAYVKTNDKEIISYEWAKELKRFS